MKTFTQKHATFLHKTLNGLADSLVKVFIPVIILSKTNNLYLCLLFMITRPIFFVLFNNLLKNFLKKHPTLSIVIHIIPIIIIQFSIFFINLNFVTILFLSLLMGLFNVFYSVPFNLLFVFSDKKLNVSKMEVGSNIGKLIFIIIGGLIINNGTVSYIIALSTAASLLYILSVVPLVFGNNLVKQYHQTQTLNTTKLSKKDKKLFNLVHISFGSFQIVIDEILPVYLFYTGLSFASIGFAQAFIELGKMLANIFAGKIYNNKNLSGKVIIAACAFYSVSLLVIFFFKSNVTAYILTSIIGLSFPLVFVPIFKKFCQLIIGKPYLMEEIKTRDSCIFSGRPFIIASYFIGLTFLTPFIIAGINSALLATSSIKLLKLKNN